MPAASTALNAWRPPASGSCSGGRGGAAAAVHSGEARIRVWSGAGLARALALRWRRSRVCSPASRSTEEAHASRLLQYPTSVELLTRALDAEGPFSALGGEIQLWLALGLQVSVRALLLPEDTGLPTGLSVLAGAQACGQEQECIDLYKALENTHPSVQVRKQAAQLRFILEAPRLKLRPDERVSVPVLETGGRFACAAPHPARTQRRVDPAHAATPEPAPTHGVLTGRSGVAMRGPRRPCGRYSARGQRLWRSALSRSGGLRGSSPTATSQWRPRCWRWGWPGTPRGCEAAKAQRALAQSCRLLCGEHQWDSSVARTCKPGGGC